MIVPPGWGGIAFSDRTDGDLRAQANRERFADTLGIGPEWAELKQVHGPRVVQAAQPGGQGAADALWTAVAGLPVAIFTADCYAVALKSESAVGVAHAGWRGALGGVVQNLATAMAAAGHQPLRAAIGPGIGPCCFEVGPEVADRFPAALGSTTWGTTSVDLVEQIRAQLPEDLEFWSSGACTMHGADWFSHRASGTKDRMVALAWI
jgi:polyphenol oxidase